MNARPAGPATPPRPSTKAKPRGRARKRRKMPPGVEEGVTPAAAAANTNVVISNLKRGVDKEALAQLAEQLGRVINFRLHTPQGPDPNASATAVVEYASAEDAARVVSHVHGRLILGQPVTAWIAIQGTSAQPLPPGPAPPQATPNPTEAPGPARAVYPGGGGEQRNVNNDDEKKGGGPGYARYPPPAHINSNEDPRVAHAANPAWERGGPPAHDPRVAERPPPPVAYGEAYSHDQPQRGWAAGGRPTRANGGNTAASRYVDEGDAEPYPTQQQWQNQEPHDNEATPWERPARNNYAPPPQHRAMTARQEHQGYHPAPPASGWPDEADSRGPHPRQAYGRGDGRLVRPMPRGGPRDSAGIPPGRLRSDGGYDEEEPIDTPGGEMRRPPPPGSIRGVPPGGRAAWTAEGAGYSAPPPVSINGEEFEKEVVRAAARLVAEREIRAREEARKEMKPHHEWPDESTQRYDDRKKREVTHNSGVHATAEGHRRTLSVEEAGRRNQREPASRDHRKPETRAGVRTDRGEWDHESGEDWRDNKRPRRDDSPHNKAGSGRIDERMKNGRDGSRIDPRQPTNGKRADEPRPMNSMSRAESRGRKQTDDRDRHREDSRGKNRDDDRGMKRDSRNRTTHGSRDRDHGTAKTTTSRPPSTRERSNNRADPTAENERLSPRADGVGSPRDGAASNTFHKHWENSTADTGYYVHVGGVSFTTTFTTLAKRFAAFGDVNGFKVIFNNVTCRSAASAKMPERRQDGGAVKEEASKAAVVTASTGFAFISFDNERGMEKAIENMNNVMLDGHVLKVSRGRLPGKPGAQHHHRSFPDQTFPRQRTPGKSMRRWPAPMAEREPEEQRDYQQQFGREIVERRPAPVSPAASAAAASVIAAAAATASTSSVKSRARVGDTATNGSSATAAFPSPSATPSFSRKTTSAGVKSKANFRGKDNSYDGKEIRRNSGGGGGAKYGDGSSGTGDPASGGTKAAGNGGSKNTGAAGSGNIDAVLRRINNEAKEAARTPNVASRARRTETRPTGRSTHALARPGSGTLGPSFAEDSRRQTMSRSRGPADGARSK